MSSNSFIGNSSTPGWFVSEYSRPKISVIRPNILVIPRGIMEDKPLSNSKDERFNIIKTNMKSIAIAPT